MPTTPPPRRFHQYLLVLPLILGACTPYHRQWRADFSTTPLPLRPDTPSAGERARRVFEIYGERLMLAHVEFTDQGTYWTGGQDGKKNQMDALVTHVKDDLHQHPEKYRQGAIFITFTHGWHNNAREGNENLARFRSSIARIQNLETNGLNRPVIGVYLSWRGKMRPDWPREYATTFWPRKEAAERIGYRGMANALMRLSLLRDEVGRLEGRLEGRPEFLANSRLIVVGHSFGAQAVFSSVARFFEDELTAISDSADRKGYVGRRWDMIVLVNPAFEAIRYDAIHRYQQWLKYEDFYSRLPRMLVVSAENDGATGKWFPLGQALDARNRALQSGEGEMVRHTLGNYDEFRTHRLEGNPPKLIMIPGRMDVTHRYAGPFYAPFARVTDNTDSIQPFMVAQASSSIVARHNGIWKESFVQFLVDLIMAREESVRLYKK